ncbi:toxin-antitoxin system YwqK family antitoxin [Aquimarina hainanensis]|uniref:Toxin-antitoxin system YwqK family antitoxin n=1 Tax=Aquimarina hainanensis TaxID=1578017 RepID=A0ABW5N3M2_9FLAO|nr:nicotinic acid mononucleotide adenyltransferase [Aquimarina sp. TRL1]QKX04413.1 nicotinic acid mononucleotide adenyltransferase [Aquimarina sp. TRL1]
MKRIITSITLLCSVALFAQETKPTFEKQGDLIKGTFYHDNGQVRQEGFYKNKKLHGKWVSYDATGKKISMGQYNNGIKTGKWFFWNEDKLSEVNYTDNKIASATTWSDKNNVVVNYNNQ